MNTLDIIILSVILIPALIGLRSGLLRSIFSLIGIVAGLFLAVKYNDKLASLSGTLNFDPKLLSLISFIFILLACYFISVMIAGKISGINPVIKTFDRIFGVILGVFKGAIIVSLFLILTTNTFNFFAGDTIDKSKFYPAVINIAPDVYNYLMKLFPDAKDFYEELDKKAVFSHDGAGYECPHVIPLLN